MDTKIVTEKTLNLVQCDPNVPVICTHPADAGASKWMVMIHFCVMLDVEALCTVN